MYRSDDQYLHRVDKKDNGWTTCIHDSVGPELLAGAYDKPTPIQLFSRR